MGKFRRLSSSPWGAGPGRAPRGQPARRRAGIPHHWLLNVRDQEVTVYRLTPDGYLVVLTALPNETVRAEHAIENAVWELLGLLEPPG